MKITNLKQPKTREEAIAYIKGKMEHRKINENLDELYYSTKVIVYRVSFTDGSSMYVSKETGEKLKEGILLKDNSDVVDFGADLRRMYEIKNVLQEEVRFVDLSEWAKQKILVEQPNLFSQWQKKFSTRLNEDIERLRKGDEIDKNLKLQGKR